ncbi:hypothetical protein ACJZ2D_006141 [Fusarium nematophilum]
MDLGSTTPGIRVTSGNIHAEHSTLVFGVNQIGSDINKEQKIAQQCKDSLFIAEPSQVRSELVDSKGDLTAGTCKWILEDRAYQSWLQSSETQLLWISGGPGRGKTMLSIFLTRKLESMVHDPPRSLLYIFCGEKLHNTEVAILSSLIWQMVERFPCLLQRALAKLRTREGNEQARTPSRVDLWDIFKDMTRDPNLGPVLCLIDGLDECHKDSTRWLLDKLRLIFDKESQSLIIPSSPFKLLMVSRNITGLHRYDRVDLERRTSETAQDVARVIDARIKEHDLFSELDEDFKDEIKTTLQERSDETFLWVGFAIQELLRAETKTEIREVLQNIPKGLDGLYSRILLRIKDERQDDVARLLRWVVQARVPLTASQLADALKLEVQTVHDLVTMSASLLVYGEQTRAVLHVPRVLGWYLPEFDHIPTESLWNTRDSVIKPVHASVSDFLKGEAKSKIQVPEKFRIDPAMTNFELAERCLGRIEAGFSASQLETRVQLRGMGDTFLPYATYIWDQHARQSEKHIGNLFDPQKSFFDQEGHRGLFTSTRGRGIRASAMGPKDSSQFVPKIKDIDCKDSLDMTALAHALALGHISTAQFLVARGASLTRYSSDVSLVPICIAFRGGFGTAEPFLKKALEVSIFDRLKWRNMRKVEDQLFFIAVASGDMKLAQLLLKHGVTLRAPTASAALKIALKSQADPSMIDLLIKHGALKNSPDFPYLIYLAMQGPEDEAFDRAEMLLQSGADPTQRSPGGTTPPLEEAVRFLNLRLVKLLLEYGADIDSLSDYSRAALSCAMRSPSQDPRLVEWLLQHGVPADIPDMSDLNLLREAIFCEHKEVLEFLLQHGADANAQFEPVFGQRGSNRPLHACIIMSRLSMAELLLQHDADVNGRGKEGCTALHLVTEATAAKIILNHGADIEARDNKSRTPLMCAASNPHYSFWQARLLEDSVGVEGEERQGRIDSVPESDTETGIIKLFLERGADVEATDSRQKTALMLAAKSQNNLGVLELLEGGADPNARDEAGMTPLHHLMLGPHPARYKWYYRYIAVALTESGADINAETRPQDGQPARTVLDLLPLDRLDWEQAEVASFLIARGALSLQFEMKTVRAKIQRAKIQPALERALEGE